MSAEVASGKRESFTSEQPKIYITQATLKLKVNAPPSADYAWRTEVITPKQTTKAEDNSGAGAATETEIAKRHVNEAAAAPAASVEKVDGGVEAATVIKQQQQQQLPHKLPIYYPPTKPIQMKNAVSDFMHVERCHTENIETMNQFVTHM